MDQIDYTRLRKIAILVTISLLLLWLLITVFTKSIIIVNAPSDLGYVINKNDGKRIHEGKGGYFGIIDTGTYYITTTDVTSGYNKQFTLSIFNAKTVSLKRTIATQYEPVTNIDLRDPYATSSELWYVNTANHQLEHVVGATMSKVNPAFSYRSIGWMRPGVGVAIGSDSGGGVALWVEGTTVKELPIPLIDGYSTSKATNNVGYVIANQKLWQVRSATDVRAIVDVPDKTTIEAVYDGGVVVALQDGVDESITVTSYSDTGKKLGEIKTPSTEAPTRLFHASVSPNGKRILISSLDGAKLYDTSFTFQEQLASDQVIGGIWKTNDEILYIYESKVWSYKIGEKESVAIIYSPVYTSIRSLVASAYPNTFYMIADANNVMTLYRAKIGGEPTASRETYMLSESNTQKLGENCTQYYMNHTSLFLVVISEGYRKDTCISSTNSFLKSITIDTAIPIQYIQSVELSYVD